MTEQEVQTTEPKKPRPEPLPPLRRLQEADKAVTPGERVIVTKQGGTKEGEKG